MSIATHHTAKHAHYQLGGFKRAAIEQPIEVKIIINTLISEQLPAPIYIPMELHELPTSNISQKRQTIKEFNFPK